MSNWKNESSLDRLFRVILGEAFLLLAFFWLGGVFSMIFYLLGVVMIFTAVSGFCGLYRLFNFDTRRYTCCGQKYIKIFLVLIIIFLPLAGSYYSAFLTKKNFLKDYNSMNNYYKQTLFNTGQDKREESRQNYDQLIIEFNKFQNKYQNYKPYAIKRDKNFDKDLYALAKVFVSAKEPIYNNGDLKVLHVELEKVRPVFQDILKRNNFSLFGVALVDFHDAMEIIIAEADNKNAQGVLEKYNYVDEKMKAVEIEANDEEIKTIRANLEALKNLASEGKSVELPAKAAELKSSFIKVYLKRG